MGSSLILLLSHVSPIRTLDSSSTGIMRVRIKRLITGSNGTPKAPKRMTQIEEIGGGGNVEGKRERRREGGEHISKCSFCDHR